MQRIKKSTIVQAVITYCNNCYEEVIKKDGCWNWGYGTKEQEQIVGKTQETEERIEIEYIQNKPNKGKIK